ncbi:MAG TPA: hypothetical protein VGM92_12760, partial [Candidatus Kapabacteria bacterium]
KDTKGFVVSAKNPTELSVTNTEMAISAHVVKTESSGDKTESLWIAHTANNAKDDDAIDYRKKNTSLKDQLTDPQYSTTPDFARTPLVPTDNSSAAKNARAAVFSVLLGDVDPTGGAVLWDGDDFMRNGTNHAKFREYSSVSIGSDDLWNIAVADRHRKIDLPTFFMPIVMSEKFLGNGNPKKNYSLESVGVHGRTIFWKLGQ